jgi:hypothetical protein
MDHWVHDYETLSNCFVAVFEHYKEDLRKVFVVHTLRDDRKELIDFLHQNKKNKEWHVSFNGLSFDSQITEHIMRDKKFLTMTADEVAKAIYQVAQDTIQRSNNRDFAKYPEWQLSIGQIDIFKLNHWDNANRRSSLKWLQFAMDWPNVQDMPIHHSYNVKTLAEIDLIIEYCINDVRSTKKLMLLSKPLLDVRTSIKNKYGINCYSYSNTKMGSELLLNLYCKATGQDPKDVKKYRTYRESIPIKDILFPYIKFQSLDLIGFHEMLKNTVIKNTKKDFKHVIKYQGYEFHYGAGGIHQCIDRGIYKADDYFCIKDLDVASLYPSIACVNGMYPAHLGKDFFRVYKNDLVDVRLAEKKKTIGKDMAIIEGFKEAANASYGNSNSEFSWLYDPKYTMETTINGQLLITMLVEDLLIHIPEAQLLQTNTDGATLKFPKKHMPIYESICKEWEKITNLSLEFADYNAMYIWDVNNYIAQYTSGKTKCKGRFEWEDLQNHKVTHLYKNKSHLIVSKALFNYFINDVPPERYLSENRNIYDYCAGIKIKGDWKFVQSCYTKTGMVEKTLQPTLRYYISSEGCKIIKRNILDGREIQVEAGTWLQQEFNIFKEKNWEDYKVDESYYLEEIYKEINNLVPPVKTQLTLEF